MKRFLVLDTFRFLGAVLVALGHFFFSIGIKNVVPNSYILVVEYFFCFEFISIYFEVTAGK